MATTTKRSTAGVTDDLTTGIAREQEHPLAEAGQEAGQTAGHLAERAAGIGFDNADRVRQQAADGIQQLAGHVRRASSELEGQQPAIANIASSAADGAERVASFLRETDARGLVHGVEDVARRQPLLFVGGAFLLGMAASRFVKAAGGSSSGDGATYGGSRYGTSGGTTGGTYRTYRSGTAGTNGMDAFRATGPGATSPGSLASDPTDEGLRP